MENTYNGSGIFIQIGAGAGDLDIRAGCRDGFTEFIKKLPREKIKKIILVEPNPLNIPLLRECWKDYKEVIIYEFAIVPKNIKNNIIELYYCPKDEPNYQVASIQKEHVQKHYGEFCELKKFEIHTKYLENFINDITNEEIELLALDIEGIDAEVILDLNFNNINIKFLSFEYIHLGDNTNNVITYLINNNFKYLGNGLDHNGYDYLFVKNMLNPICFSIPEEKIVNTIPKKTKMLSDLIPGNCETYIYKNETEYYNEYRKSMFATTRKKVGWDCMRHYEIIANGCIPYFINIEECPKNTMYLLPKNLLIEGNLLYNDLKDKNINELTETDIHNYNNLVIRLLDYTKKHLITNKMANYILEKTNNLGVTRILFLSGCVNPDYLRCVTLQGFKEIMGVNCHDYPKVPHIYKSNTINYYDLYGKGISYTNLLESKLHNDNLDSTIEEDIKNTYYDIVIYGSYHRGMPYYDLISKIYAPDKIILLCGEDEHDCNYNIWLNKGHYVFVRELK
jgi:FkbM family methyltransferase